MTNGTSAVAVRSSTVLTTAEISATAQQITEWLLTAPIQQACRPYAGRGVAGWLEADGAPSFAYGEITGYWLTWLSGIRGDQPRAASCAAAAVAFLGSIWSGAEPPPTRLYAAPAPADWRNRAVFTFDMAMILRGLAHATEIVGGETCEAAARRVAPWVERCIADDGSLHPYLPWGGGSPLPLRWSTQPGPFQAKAAAALLRVPPAWLPQRLRDAARATLAKWEGQAARHTELHPRFYAIEGSILSGGHADPELAGTAIPPDGRLAEDQADPDGLVRADVLAQGIRILTLVEGEAAAAARQRAMVLAGALIHHVAPDGGILFRRGSGPRNVWCSMFAAQALSWLAAGSAGQAIERDKLV
jgi:hypothetical protein